MEPANGPLEDHFPLQRSGFQVPCSCCRVYIKQIKTVTSKLQWILGRSLVGAE